jgi:hypothetical protein
VKRDTLAVDTQGVLAGDDVAHLSAYHTASPLAVASLLLGLLSPVCGLGPMLLMVPLAGVAAAIAALRQIAASDGALFGRRAALIGLVLSVAFGFASAGHALATRQLRISQANELGRQWIAQLLHGDTKKAFRQMTGGTVPTTPPPDAELGPGGDPFKQFLNFPAVKALLAAGADAVVRDDGTADYAAGWGGEFNVRQRYVVTPHSPTASTSGAAAAPFKILLTLRRSVAFGDSQASWLIANAVTGDEAAEADRGN